MSYCDSTISSTLIIYDLFMFGEMYSVVSYFWCHEDFHKGVPLPWVGILKLLSTVCNISYRREIVSEEYLLSVDKVSGGTLERQHKSWYRDENSIKWRLFALPSWKLPSDLAESCNHWGAHQWLIFSQWRLVVKVSCMGYHLIYKYDI